MAETPTLSFATAMKAARGSIRGRGVHALPGSGPHMCGPASGACAA
jgi:hypothetical protein